MPTPPSSPDRVRVFARTLVALALLGAAPLGAQQQVADTTRPPTLLPGVVTTATRTPKLLSEIAAPVIAVDSTKLRTAMPNTAADLLRELPGVDVTGVGTNQARPVIRGQRGQRILLLQDGIRLNNSRRQQDFGELPALVDVNDIARVEIVRGPSSVLYGTDAIGGVINLITREPASEGMHGQFGYLHGGSDDAQRRGFGSLSQRVGRFSYRVSGSYRETSDYSAPAGSFGDLRLAESRRVQAHPQRVDRMYGDPLLHRRLVANENV